MKVTEVWHRGLRVGVVLAAIAVGTVGTVGTVAAASPPGAAAQPSASGAGARPATSSPAGADAGTASTASTGSTGSKGSKGSKGSGTAKGSKGSKTPGQRTVTWAEAPQAAPDFIFPLVPRGRYCSVANTEQFQYLMFRPLYSFGLGRSPALDPGASLGRPPKYTHGDKTVTVVVKSAKWQDGETVDGADVVFFMNLYHAEKVNACSYVPGFMPDDVTGVSAAGQTVTFTLSHAVNPRWFTSNELSQITPIPIAWDKTALDQGSGTGGCANAPYGAATTDTACQGVYTFLSNQAGYDASHPTAPNLMLASYSTNPLWSVVDGPWSLKSFSASGRAVFTPNPSYAGSPKPAIARFEEIPSTSWSSEAAALRRGALSVGALPLRQAPAAAGPGQSGRNDPELAATYSLSPLYSWSISSLPLNLRSTGNHGTAGKIFSQTYFRQAMQSLVDQPQAIRQVYGNYAVPTYGPVPLRPKTALAAKVEKTDPFPFDPTHAQSLLSRHGWKVVPGGTDTCTEPGSGPGHCGPGIPKGTKLSFTLEVATGNATLAALVRLEKSWWSRAGIRVTPVGAPLDTVIDDAQPCPNGCAWEMADWGASQIFTPDTYPSGESQWAIGAAANYGSYHDATNQRLIAANTSANRSLAKWAGYLSRQVPALWQPDPVAELTEVHKGLRGVTPQNVYWGLRPEQWRWSK